MPYVIENRGMYLQLISNITTELYHSTTECIISLVTRALAIFC